MQLESQVCNSIVKFAITYTFVISLSLHDAIYVNVLVDPKAFCCVILIIT